MKYLPLLALLLCAGCATTRQTPPPSVTTAKVIESLTDTQDILNDADKQNSEVARKIDRALTLAEKLDALLAEIEKESQPVSNKNVIKPE